ncbi:MAG: hypothetical protein RSB59_03410 [Clostridia bacterium]
MSRVIDYISLTFIIFLLTFVWTTLAFSSWIVALIFSVAITLISVITTKFFLSKRHKPYSYDRLSLELSVQGNEYLINLIKSAIKNKQIESSSNYILTKDCVLFAMFKFAPLSINDLSTVAQQANKLNRKSAYVMCRGVDRRAYSVLQLMDITVQPIKIKQIYKFLERHNALPNLKPKRIKFSFSAFFATLFQRSNTKNYIFSAVILLSVAYLTPLKIYYLVFGSLSLLFALLTLTPLGKGSFKLSKVFDALDKEESNQISIDDLDK